MKPREPRPLPLAATRRGKGSVYPERDMVCSSIGIENKRVFFFLAKLGPVLSSE